MGGEKRGSKKGVGGFLQLFDWNSKSRKKLFSSKNDLSEQITHRKRDEELLPKSRVRLVDVDGIQEVAYSAKGSSDYSCASSVTDGEGYRTRAPGVVARLMGLDSLPSPNVSEPYSSPVSDTCSLRDAPFRRKDLDFYRDPKMMPSANFLDKVGSSARKPMEPKPLMTPRKPIEKFQAEILPPRSAKSIPITHHKLLSPIKTPGFIPSRDAAYIMEAAAKIIEPGPQATPRSKISSTGSSSVSFKVRELREKLEAAQRPVDASSSKCLKGSSVDKSLNSLADTAPFKFSSDTAGSSACSKNKGRSVSLAVQAKVNVQRREGGNSSNRSLDGLKVLDEVRPGQLSDIQPHCLKSIHKKSSAHSAPGVLRQNSQKQNCPIDKEKLTSKSSVPNMNMRGRKTVTGSPSHGRQSSLGKDVSRSLRKSSLEARQGDKGIQYSEVENVPRKRRSIVGNLQCDQRQSITLVDRHLTLIEESRKNGMDVVSFTFTTPLTRGLAGSEPSCEISGSPASSQRKKTIPGSDGMGLSSFGQDALGADALSILLEQKLRELTQGCEDSHKNAMKETSSVRHNFVPANAGSSIPSYGNIWSMDSQIYSAAFSLTKHEDAGRKYMLRGREDVGECNCDRAEITKSEESRTPSPVSILGPSLLTESCNSSGSATSYSMMMLDSKQCSSAEMQKDICLTSSSLKEDYTAEVEMDLLDSASSSLSENTSARTHGIQGKDWTSSSQWELEYLNGILCDMELMLEDYALGRTQEVMNPNIFEKLERRSNNAYCRSGEDEGRLARKVVFDSASECLELRCQRFVGGGQKMWAKGVAVVRTKGKLAEEVYREINGWRSLGNCMVDELVERDMSSQYGNWLDYKVDEFALGTEMEGEICESLIDEVIADILPWRRRPVLAFEAFRNLHCSS